MKFSLISDMHVNHPQPKTPYDLLEEIVIVAGDTSNGLEGLKFLNKLRNKGHTVIAIDGNHESYANLSQQRTIDDVQDRFREEFPPVIDIDNIRFIQTNGWYPVYEDVLWRNYMNDSHYCVTTAEQMVAKASSEAEWMSNQLAEAVGLGKKVVVTTHTAPTLVTLNPQFAEHFSNEWYWNPEMEGLLPLYKDDILVWCHGHTHAPADANVDGVRVVCNPRGYPDENPHWLPKTVEVKE